MSGTPLPPPAEHSASTTCASIILFHPDEHAWANTAALAGQADRLIVIDNTPVPAPPAASFPPHVHLFHNHNQGGIAGALNKAATTALEWGFEHMVFLDQDSQLPVDFVRRMVDFCQQQNADMAGPRVFEEGGGVYLRYKRIRTFSLKRIDTGTLERPAAVSFIITSGSVINLKTYLRIGPFRDDFFIDHVDTEYCLRLQKAGGLILINPAVEMRHAIGAAKSVSVTRQLYLISSCHAAWRRYFIGFNGARTSRLYWSDYPVFVAWTGLIVVKEAVAIMLLDDKDRTRRARALIGGYFAGWWRTTADNPYMTSNTRANAPDPADTDRPQRSSG